MATKEREAKRGRWSHEEEGYMTASFGKHTAEEMAVRMNRTLEAVKGWLEKYKRTQIDKVVDEKTARVELRSSQAWQRLKQKFTDEELKLFEERWVDWVNQFREDMVASEEQQIMKVITYEILMDRNLVERRRTREEIEVLKTYQQDILGSVKGDPRLLGDMDKERLMDLETQMVTLRESDKSMTKEYTDLEGKQQSLMKDLKATRDQRISRIESSKTSWVGLIRELEREDNQARIGHQMELMRLATTKEEGRLAAPHVYMDGNEDLPILSDATIERLDAVNAEKDKE